MTGVVWDCNHCKRTRQAPCYTACPEADSYSAAEFKAVRVREAKKSIAEQLGVRS